MIEVNKYKDTFGLYYILLIKERDKNKIKSSEMVAISELIGELRN